MKENTALWKFGAVALLLLTSCSKPIEEAPSFSPSLDDTSEIISEAEPESHRSSDSVMLTTTVKSAYVNPTATMAYEKGGSNSTMKSTGNAADVGLDASIFEVDAGAGNSSGLPGLNGTNGDIRLYASPTDGDGAYFDVSIKDGAHYWISSIEVTCSLNAGFFSVYGTGPVAIPAVDGSYPIDGASFRIKNTQKEDADRKTVRITSVVITYEGAAEDVVKEMDTTLSLSYDYEKDESGENDFIDLAATGRATYGDWTKTDYSSGVDYKGYSGKSSSAIAMNNTNPSGIVTTDNPNNHEIHRITVVWNSGTADGRVIDVYAKNTPYSGGGDLYATGSGSAETKGTKVTSLAYDKDALTTVYVFTTAYKHIGIRSNSGALYVDSITIDWDTYDYSDAAIRFGSLIRKSLWDRLDTESTIAGYGVFLSTATYLGSDSIKDKYDAALAESTIDGAIAAITAGNNIKNFYTALDGEHLNPAAATNEQKGELTGDYYIWNLYKSVSTANLKTSYTAAAYIRVDGKIIFINEHSTSIKALAAGLVAGDAYDESSFDGSLNNLANLA